MSTFASLFSGGGGADLGAKAAGYASVFGIENDPAIADVARSNSFAVLTADARAIDYTTLPRVDWLHASPPCINASVAKANAGEAGLDGELAFAVCCAIDKLQPERFTLENVWGYRTFDAFKMILGCLTFNGYSYEYWHLNSASYGVPQTRKRLILVARLGTWRIQRPEPTHCKGGDMWLPPWIGWYEAIEDLIPTLPESRFADWQRARLPAELVGSSLMDLGNTSRDATVLACDEPSMAVQAWHGRRPSHLPQAFLMSNAATEYGDGIRADGEPCHAVTSQSGGRTRAFLMRSQNSEQAGGNQVRYSDDPAMCITAEERPRAFLVGGANTSDGQAGPGVGVSAVDEPSRCVNASNSQYWRAWLSQGRVVSMTPRALARLMSVPDTYILPVKTSLACRVLGNACTPRLFQRLAESWR